MGQRESVHEECERRGAQGVQKFTRVMLDGWTFITEYTTANMNPAVSCLICLRQGDRAIEEYVEDFCNLCHLVKFSVAALKGIFCNGFKDNLYDLMPDNRCSATLEQYIDFALSLVGSPFTVGTADEECNPTVPTTPNLAHIMSAPGLAHATPAAHVIHAYAMPAGPGPAHAMPAAPGPALAMPAALPESAPVMAAIPEPVYKMAAIPEPVHKMAAMPEPVHKMADPLISCQVRAALSVPSQVTAVFPEQSQVTAVVPESSQVTAVVPDSSQVTAGLPESSQVTPESPAKMAATPESCHVMALPKISPEDFFLGGA
ncbi:hypothetical protein H4Q32_027638 [Labeo rohita]|uniref:Retrotransposon gag domain-containing protein n=1 Tax=Labeo rohita TaxID=84645 RepID=A0ABQ8L7A0_LABRO|nr:hypothetical protein H4Q32_027638 [Labeo rohita]